MTLAESMVQSLNKRKDDLTIRTQIDDADLTALTNFNGTLPPLVSTGTGLDYLISRIKGAGNAIQTTKIEAPAKIAEIDALIADIND
jgi:cytochrome c-type biogenesis protein CcmE